MSKMTIDRAISTLIQNRPFAYSELQEAIDIAIETLKLQKKMEKHCNSHDCIDCRTLGMCASTFMLDEL